MDLALLQFWPLVSRIEKKHTTQNPIERRRDCSIEESDLQLKWHFRCSCLGILRVQIIFEHGNYKSKTHEIRINCC